jgi:hypothetical protein
MSKATPTGIIATCLAAFNQRTELKTEVIDETQFKVILGDNEFTVSLESVDEVDDDEIGKGQKLSKLSKPVKAVKDHVNVLDVCLHALANDDAAFKAISDVTTDGDHKDCEAIFALKDYFYRTLKVR